MIHVLNVVLHFGVIAPDLSETIGAIVTQKTEFLNALACNDLVTLTFLLILDPEAIAGFPIFANALIAPEEFQKV